MFKNIFTCLILVFCVVMNAYAQDQAVTVKDSGAVARNKKASVKQKQVNGTVLKLKISADGKAIIDEQGNEIARFTKGIRVKSTGKSATLSLPGCMCCKNECLAYDSTGKCVKWYRSCTWDFDCNCK